MKNTANTCFFTGHRIIPNAHRELLAAQTEQVCSALITDCGVTDFIAGGALGYDTLAAETVLRLRSKLPNIRLHLYLPCRDQTGRWRAADQLRWRQIADTADVIRYITDSNYVTGCMQRRNRAMADDSLYGIAYLTRRSGGTYQTFCYARELGRQLTLLPLRNSSLDF